MRTGTAKLLFAAAPLVAVVLLGATVYVAFAASLPRTSGEAAIPKLAAAVTIELDAHAVPRVRAESLLDAFRAQGFLHAQQRFFQMDLARRSAAGELAALFGARALPLDRERRPQDLRRRAAVLLERWPERHRDWLEAYAEGVNAGTADLKARPPEYWLLGATPEPWTAVDSVLVLLAFYTMLSNNEAYERPQAVMHAALPPALYDFLTPSTTRFDRPLGAPADDPTGGYSPQPVPPPAAVDLRNGEPPAHTERIVRPPEIGPASNQWAVGGRLTRDGVALLANDPHLELGLPAPFYRAELYWPGGSARGLSIPGLPGIVLGATDAIAWGATVSNADQSDWVVVETASDASAYLTPEGAEPFTRVTHSIAVADAEPELIHARVTRWGPVLAKDGLGRLLALRATWLDPDGADLTLLELMTARTVEDAVRVAGAWAGPSLNWAFADRDGRVAWTVNGPLPRRRGFDGSRPVTFRTPGVGWDGRHAPPVSFGDARGAVFNANNRSLPEPRASELSRVWMRPLRAKRIDDLLRGASLFDERALHRMQLDTRAEGYDALRDLLLEVVEEESDEPLLARARALVAGWNGHADVDEPGFRILQLYYRELLERVLGPLLAQAAAADPEFVYRWPLADEPLRRLLEERPTHLLPRGFDDWRRFLAAVLRDALAAVERDPGRPAIDAAWGEVNRLDVGHLFAGLPVIGARLKAPSAPLAGSTISLRRASPNYGSVFRMVVSPARPEAGILQMFGGQSGHFLSRNFDDFTGEWLDDTPTPFLAGPTASTFRLVGE